MRSEDRCTNDQNLLRKVETEASGSELSRIWWRELRGALNACLSMLTITKIVLNLNFVVQNQIVVGIVALVQTSTLVLVWRTLDAVRDVLNRLVLSDVHVGACHGSRIHQNDATLQVSELERSLAEDPRHVQSRGAEMQISALAAVPIVGFVSTMRTETHTQVWVLVDHDRETGALENSEQFRMHHHHAQQTEFPFMFLAFDRRGSNLRHELN